MNVLFEHKGWHFEWDSEKDAENIKKHGINFESAAISFRDEEYMLIPDYKHSIMEERWVNLSLEQGSLLVVCFSYRETDAGIPSHRIISAHKISTKKIPKHRKRLGTR